MRLKKCPGKTREKERLRVFNAIEMHNNNKVISWTKISNILNFSSLLELPEEQKIYGFFRGIFIDGRL